MGWTLVPGPNANIGAATPRPAARSNTVMLVNVPANEAGRRDSPRQRILH